MSVVSAGHREPGDEILDDSVPAHRQISGSTHEAVGRLP
jgi:hypothetical protein